MKKINISSQLLLLFFSIILIASCAFSIITLQRIEIIAEDEVYSRLCTYSKIIHDKEGGKLPDVNVGFYISDGNSLFKSKSLSDYVDDAKLNEIITEVYAKKDNNIPEFYAKSKYKLNGKTIYFVLYTQNNMETYTIIFTDSAYTTKMVKNVSLQVILLFFLLLLLSTYIIYLWSTHFVKRIRSIQNHIENLPKNNYEVAYVDDSLDEIGELSRSIEEMRIEIGQNEKTKQEMLQNLSHDFKTPIAVIKSYAEAQIDGMVDEESSKIIANQADLLKKKVNRLLQYNSLEYLSKDKEFEAVNMKELINEVVQNYRYQTNLDFELDLDDEVYFQGYRENLYTVVDNIVDNAKRYAKTKIKIVLKKNRLRIYNDGDHIDEQFLNSIFKPYEKGSKGEFGLGMSIVKKTIDFFGLDLKVVNEEVGVSFIISKNE